MESYGSPKVGIYWYNPKNNGFFSVAENLDEGYNHNREVGSNSDHMIVWEMPEHKSTIERKLGLSPELVEYEEIPRGRVGYKADTKTHIVYCASDMVNNPSIKSRIIDDFNVNQIKYITDQHYEILSDADREELFK
jgi:hypothetical protein